MTPKKWVGLAEVLPVEGNDALGLDPKGAFVSIAGLAASAESFAVGAREFCADMGFDLKGIDSIEELEPRIERNEIDPSLLEASRGLSMTQPFAFGTFDTFPLSE